MFGKKKPKCPAPNYGPFSPSWAAPTATGNSMFQMTPLSLPGNMASNQFTVSALGLQPGATLTAGSPLLQERLPPEPTTPPKTVFGLVGYRLYTLDDELYLRGLRGERQEGQVSKQAKHEKEQEGLFTIGPMGPAAAIKGDHLAPAWGCLCGFGAMFSPMSFDKPDWRGVVAEVQAEGLTVVSETGWRAERITLTKLWVGCPILPDSTRKTLEERYEVPVEVLR